MIPLSVLDLSPVAESSDAGQALRQLRRPRPPRRALRPTAATGWPSTTTWRGIASAATSVALGLCRPGDLDHPHRGRAGIMLPKPRTAGHRRAVRHTGRAQPRPHRPRCRPRAGLRPDHRAGRFAGRWPEDIDAFPQDVLELIGLFRPPPSPDRQCARHPARAWRCRSWILGSSLYGAQLAAALGLPYAFASHFAPDAMMQALELYRSRFRPSARLDRALRHAGPERGRRRHGHRGAPALHLPAAGLRAPALWASRQAAAAGGRHRRGDHPPWSAPPSTTPCPCAVVGGPLDRAPGGWRPSPRARAPTS